MTLQAKVVRMVAVLALAVTAFSGHAHAQARNSGARPIALQAVLPPSLTVALSGNAVNFNMAFGSANNPGNTSITATTSWAVNTAIGLVSLYAYFGNSASALSDGAGNNIPSADFLISDNGGAFNALTNTVALWWRQCGAAGRRDPDTPDQHVGLAHRRDEFQYQPLNPADPAGGYLYGDVDNPGPGDLTREGICSE